MTVPAYKAPPTSEQLEDELRQFYGSETIYRHRVPWLPSTECLHYTEGVRYLAERAGAYWLLDAIQSHQPSMRDAYGNHARFQVWCLYVYPDRSCELHGGEDRTDAGVVCALTRAGSHVHRQVTQQIEYTDFPSCGIRLYVVNNTIMLPSEY